MDAAQPGRGLFVTALVFALAGLAGGCVMDELEDGETETIGSDSEAIVNGQLSTDFPGTGILLFGNSENDSMLRCSGTLIGCDTFLTAAHCVCEGFGSQCSNISAQPFRVYLQNGGIHQVANVAVHPSYNENIENDVAVLTLSEPVTGVPPISMVGSDVPPGSSAVIVGYGRTGGDQYEYGIKRQGNVVTTTCDGVGQDKLCWRYDGSGSSSPSNVCHGDSGGSTYVVNGGQVAIVGVHSTTNIDTCLETSGTFPSADAAVSEYREFVNTVGGPGMAQSECGDLPMLGSAGTQVVSESGSIALGESAYYAIEVPKGTAELRVAMNSTDGAGANLDLYVKRGEVPSPGLYDCAADGSTAHGFCTIDSPEPGVWNVQVVANASASSRGGDYQMIATTFGSAPIAEDDRYGVAIEGETLIMPTEGVLANDQKSSRGSLTAELVSQPEHGEVSVNAEGAIRYVTDGSYVGDVTFKYRASDGSYSGVGVVTLTIGGSGASGVEAGACSAGGSSSGSAALLLLIAAAITLTRRRRA